MNLNCNLTIFKSADNLAFFLIKNQSSAITGLSSCRTSKVNQPIRIKAKKNKKKKSGRFVGKYQIEFNLIDTSIIDDQ